MRSGFCGPVVGGKIGDLDDLPPCTMRPMAAGSGRQPAARQHPHSGEKRELTPPRKLLPSRLHKYADRCPAQPQRLSIIVSNTGCEVARRGVDDLQHLGGRGLVLQRLARLAEQARILHRDHRLGGEVLQQRDLLLRERADFSPVNVKGTRPGRRPCTVARRGLSALAESATAARGAGLRHRRGDR